MVDEILISVPEACRRLGVKKSLLWPILMRGDIASLRIGRRRLVSVRAVREFAERLETEQAVEIASVR
jgi:excisionase family DNA binding protein